MRRRVEFIGGPMCGKVFKIPEHQLTRFVGCVVGMREYLYRYRLGSEPGVGNPPIKLKRRYVFQGHNAKVEVDDGY